MLANILAKVPLHDTAHGFRPGRSIVSNAAPHLQHDVVINVDLKDFFPSISYRRVKGLFRALGYAESAATVFGLLCTEPDVEEVELDGRRWFVALSERHLPQGAPGSPAITNLLCRRLDRRLEKMATELGFTYTRYADDLSLSASGDAVRHVGKVLRRLSGIVAHEGFDLHPNKTRVQRRGGRREVTGLITSGDRPRIPREVLRRFRATLYQIEKDGPAGKRWGPSPDVLASARGFANYVRMVDPDKGQALVARVQALLEKHGWKPTRTGKALPRTAAPPTSSHPLGRGYPAEPSAQTPPPEAPKDPAKPKKKWWKLW